MIELEVLESVADFIQGRAPKNVLARHYNPQGIRMLKGIYEKADLKVLI
jgi:intergrase/recombinase